MTTPGPGDQPPQHPGQGWGQQPPTGQPGEGQPPTGQPGEGQPTTGQPGQGQPQQPGQWRPPGGQQPGQPGQFGQPGQQPGQQFGQPGQQPFGQQGPGQQGQPWAGQQFSGEAPKKERPAWQKRLPLVIGAVVAAVVFAAFRNGLFSGPTADVGDCLNASSSEIGPVDCDSDEAAYRVVAVVEDTTQASLIGGSACADFPTADSYAFESARTGGEGTGYCLEPIS